MVKIILVVLTVAVAFSILGGCLGEDKIGNILKNTGEYENKTVNIKGEVIETMSIPFVSHGTYKIDDGTGSIWVITPSGTPAKGKEVSVKGVVKTAFKIGDSSLGTVVIEGARN